MNKHHAHHYWRYTRHFRWQYLLAAAGIAGIVCLLALRNNSQQMAIRRDAVYAADKDGGDVQTALTELQRYVTAHMNTNLTTGNANVYPPIQLQYTYERLAKQGAAQQTSNDQLYTDAQAYCQRLNPNDFSGRNRVPCIEKYVQERGAAIKMAQTVSPSLYQFNFISPRWSPDLAGWSLLATIGLAVLAITKFAGDFIFRRHK